MGGIPAATADRRRLVFVIDSLTAAGTERHLLRLVAGLEQRGRWDISVYCLSRSGSFIPAMEQLGVDVAGRPEPMRWSPGPLFSRFIDLYRYFRRERPVIAHCYLTASGVLGAAAARLAGVPHVVTTRRTVYAYTGRKLLVHRIAMAITSRLSDVVVCVCEAAREQGIRDGTPPEKLVTVYNSIPALEFPPRRGRFAGRPVVGTLGALHRRKGHVYLIEAMPEVAAALPDVQVVIAGIGGMQSTLERRIAELGIESRVQLVGEEEAEGFLAELDMFVFPSTFEGMPNAVMEAMLAGLPVIATRVGGIPEIVRDGESGILVEPCSPAELAAAIIRLWNDAAARRRYAAAGRQSIAQRFGDVQREVNETEAVYDRLLPRGEAAAGSDRAERAAGG